MTRHETVTATIPVQDVATITPRIGAQIDNITLSGDLPDAVIAEIKTLIAGHKVVFLRGQDHLGDAGQAAFARRLDALVPHPTQPVHDGSSAVLELDSHQGTRADQWHTDVTFVSAYPKYSVLRGYHSPDRSRHDLDQYRHRRRYLARAISGACQQSQGGAQQCLRLRQYPSKGDRSREGTL
jgi:taurine dioxygenase